LDGNSPMFVVLMGVGALTGLSMAGNVGMLVVESVVPGSMSDGVLEPGDVLVRVNGEFITHFLPLEDTLDRCGSQESLG
jgi:PDZ domain